MTSGANANSSEFLARKAISGALAIAFGSMISQLELLVGSCGIRPGSEYSLLVAVNSVGLLCSVGYLLGVKAINKLGGLFFLLMAALYAFLCFASYGLAMPHADQLLIEAALILGLTSGSSASTKFFLVRLLVSTAASKFVDVHCDNSWYGFKSLKADALNQPFPFTAVWHVAQLPQRVVAIISILVVVAESLLPVLCLISKRFSALEQGSICGMLLLVVYYSVIGNFNWTPLVVFGLSARLLTADIVNAVFGLKTLTRWGFDSSDGAVAEKTILKCLKGCVIVSLMISTFCALVSFGYTRKEVQIVPKELVGVIGAGVLTLLFAIAVRHSFHERSRAGVVLMLVGLALSRSAYLHILTKGVIGFENDYSALPTCFSFKFNLQTEFPNHSNAGRAVFLFQTKYSELGTNTVGANLGGTRYAELAPRGSVHGDEERPPFLMGHFPRISYELWLMGTSDFNNLHRGLAVVKHLETLVESGSPGIALFFPDTNPAVLQSLIHNHRSNPIQAFYQLYEVTHRAADHQWWKRSNEAVAALPPVNRDVSGLAQCQYYIPAKVFGLHLDALIIMTVIGLLVAKILLTRVPGDEKRKRK